MFNQKSIEIIEKVNHDNFLKKSFSLPNLSDIGFLKSHIQVENYRLNILDNYKKNRDNPGDDKTSYLSVHLRFGTVSIRSIISCLLYTSPSPRDRQKSRMPSSA